MEVLGDESDSPPLLLRFRVISSVDSPFVPELGATSVTTLFVIGSLFTP